MDEVKEQVKDGISRITQLVSIDKKLFMILAIADIHQAEGQRCNMVIWATTDEISQVAKNASLLARKQYLEVQFLSQQKANSEEAKYVRGKYFRDRFQPHH
jgi:hypothetical protein